MLLGRLSVEAVRKSGSPWIASERVRVLGGEPWTNTRSPARSLPPPVLPRRERLSLTLWHPLDTLLLASFSPVLLRFGGIRPPCQIGLRAEHMLARLGRPIFKSSSKDIKVSDEEAPVQED
jgi:hypothetical protein